MSLTDFSTLGLPNETARRVAEMVSEYDPDVTLERLPDGHPRLIDAPHKRYALIHHGMGLGTYVIDQFAEADLDHRVLAALIEGDMHRAGKKLENFQPLYWARQLMAEREKADKLASDQDRMAFALRKRDYSGKLVL